MSDSECDSLICEAGQCLSETTIAYASPTGSATSGCTKDLPCTLVRARNVVDATRTNIKLLPGTHELPQVAGESFSGGYQLTIYGPATIHGVIPVYGQASTPTRVRLKNLDVVGLVSGQPASLLIPIPTVELDHVTLDYDPALQTSSAVSVSTCVLNVRDSSIRVASAFTEGISAGGIGGGGGQLATIERSRVLVTSSAAISVQEGAGLRMSNSVVVGGDATNGSILLGTSVAASSVAFSTLYNGVLRCRTGNLVLASQNNIFLNETSGAPADTVTGTACTHNYDLIKPQSASPAGANNILNMDPRFVNGATGDFHLVAGSPAIDAADPAATESVDLEGTARPQGARRDLGALEYK